MYSPFGHGPRSGRLNDLMVMIPARLRQRPRRHDHCEDDLRSGDADGFSDDNLFTSIRGMRRHDSRSASERIPVPVLHASQRPHFDANDVYVFPIQIQRVRLEIRESGHRIAVFRAAMGGNMRLREVEQQLIGAQGDVMGRRARLRVRAGRQEHRSFLDMRVNELLHNSHGEVILVLDYGSRTSGRRHESGLGLGNY